MDDMFGKYSEYMAIGYAAMGVILVMMILWIAIRYRSLHHEQEQIAALEAEIQAERANK